MDVCKCAEATCSIIKATITRLLFVLQSVITTWRVVDTAGDPNYWFLLITVVPLVIESFYTIIKRKGAEFKWFAPSYLCFLLCTVPGIWLLELNRWDRFHSRVVNGSSPVSLSTIHGVSIPIYLDADTWIQALEQVLMLLLVVSRWLLPKGEITRERLSQILLVYIALASDIIELFDLYELDQVMHDWMIFRLILVSWSVSLIQFTLVLAASKSGHKRHAIAPTEQPGAGAGEKKVDRVEVMALMLTLILQDMPFLAIRLYIIIRYMVLSNTLLFFAAKNALVIVLQFYRLAIVVCGISEEDKDGDGVIDRPNNERQANGMTAVET